MEWKWWLGMWCRHKPTYSPGYFSRSTDDQANADLWINIVWLNPSTKCHFCICDVCRNLSEFLSECQGSSKSPFLVTFGGTQYFLLIRCISKHPFYCLSVSEVSWVALLYGHSWGLDWVCHLVQLADVTGITLLLAGRQAPAGCWRTGSLLEASELGLRVSLPMQLPQHGSYIQHGALDFPQAQIKSFLVFLSFNHKIGTGSLCCIYWLNKVTESDQFQSKTKLLKVEL